MTTNIAARLAAQAEGGEIVLSEETRARLGADAAPEDMGLCPLKGVERPMRLFRLR
jgi:class 3 adenylate cyclase